VDLEAETGKHAVEGWNAILQAHLGPAGATLVWTILWVAVAVLGLVFARYVGVLGAGGAAEGTPERDAYDDLRASLTDGGSPTRIYSRLLTRFLDGVDRFFSDHDKADLGILRHAFGLGDRYPPWTGAALDRCLLLALLYPIASVLMIWAISDHVGPAEMILGLQPDVPGWQRGTLVAALLGCLIAAWRASESTGRRNVVWWLAATAAGLVSAVAAGAVDVAAVGVSTVALGGVILAAINGAGAVAVAFAIAAAAAGAVAGPGAVTNAVAVAVGVGVSFGVAAAGAVVIAIAWLSNISARARRQGAFLSAYGTVMLALVISLARGLSHSWTWDAFGPVLLLLGLLTLLDALFYWLSVGLTRALLRRGVELQGWWPYVLATIDVVLSLAILIVLAGAMVIGVQAFDLAATLGGATPTLPLRRLFYALATHPRDPVNWWLYAMLLATLIPSVTNLFIGSTSLTRGVPGVSTLLLRFLPAGVTVTAFDRTWIAAVLTAQWAIGLILMLSAFALLGWLVSILVPEVGTLFLDYARAIAALDLPGQAWSLVSG
jgi:hypothetical protein